MAPSHSDVYSKLATLSLNGVSKLAAVFSFPTLNLDLEKLVSTRPILPIIPLLKIFHGFDNTMVFPPDLGTIIELETDHHPGYKAVEFFREDLWCF